MKRPAVEKMVYLTNRKSRQIGLANKYTGVGGLKNPSFIYKIIVVVISA